MKKYNLVMSNNTIVESTDKFVYLGIPLYTSTTKFQC